MAETQWYSNKELFELINHMKDDFKELSMEMKQTREIIKKYNGLRKEIGEVKDKVEDLEAETRGKNKVMKAIREWGGWLFACITFLILIYKTF